MMLYLSGSSSRENKCIFFLRKNLLIKWKNYNNLEKRDAVIMPLLSRLSYTKKQMAKIAVAFALAPYQKILQCSLISAGHIKKQQTHTRQRQGVLYPVLVRSYLSS